MIRVCIFSLVACIILAALIGCGSDGTKDGSADWNAALSDSKNREISKADEDVIAVNQEVLLNEAQMSFPDVASPAGTVKYYLPFEAGKHRGASQGINGSTSHMGKLSNAIDWNLTGYNDYRLPVLASARGTVVLANMRARFGNCVVIRHVDGSKTRYAHLDEITVAVGQYVGQAGKIGLVGTTGHSTGPHLHFEILDAQMNGMFPVFAESIATPVGDMPCTTESEESGCYESQNSPASEP